MIEVDLSSLDRVKDYFDSFIDVASQSMAFALNRVVPGAALKRYKTDMLEQTAFPAGYLDQRVTVTQLATVSDLTAKITGRDRATSLARFVTSGALGQSGVEVTVNPGNSRPIKSGFLVSLKRGNEDGAGGNIGLAIRLKPGQTLQNTTKSDSLVYLAKNVVLLYGPSVGQVLDDVAENDEDAVVEDIMSEFDRQFVRLA